MNITVNRKDRISFGYPNTVELLQKEFDYIKKYTECYEELSYKEKYQLLTNYFTFRYNTNDIIKLINIKGHHNYTRLVDIPTTIIRNDGIQFILTCATHDTFKLDYLVYSKEELIDLINNHTIYPVYFYVKVIKLDDIDKLMAIKNKYKIETEKNKDDKWENQIKDFVGDYININVDEHANWDNRLEIIPKEKGLPLLIKFIEVNTPKELVFSTVKNQFKNLLDYLELSYCYSHDEEDKFYEMKEYYNTFFKGKRYVKNKIRK